jgi:hypothetical protein
MNFKNRDEYIHWVNQWKININKFTDLQTKIKQFAKSVHHGNVELTAEEIETLKEHGGYWKNRAVGAAQAKEYGSFCFYDTKIYLRSILREQYEQRAAGKEFYHANLAETEAAA